MIPPIFVSGPHGSGKTTMIRRLLADTLFVENDFDMDFLRDFPTFSTMTHFEKCLVRLFHRKYLTEYSLTMAERLAGKAIITSRGIYDSVAYIRSYAQVGWITAEQKAKMDFIAANPDALPYTIVLNPRFEVVKARLGKRIEKGSRKQRDQVFNYEDSDEFVQILCEAFEEMRDLPNVLYIEDNGPADIDAIYDWLERISLKGAVRSRTLEHV